MYFQFTAFFARRCLKGNVLVKCGSKSLQPAYRLTLPKGESVACTFRLLCFYASCLPITSVTKEGVITPLFTDARLDKEPM